MVYLPTYDYCPTDSDDSDNYEPIIRQKEYNEGEEIYADDAPDYYGDDGNDNYDGDGYEDTTWDEGANHEFCALEAEEEITRAAMDWGSDDDAMEWDRSQTVESDQVPQEEVDLEPVKREDIEPVEPLVVRKATPIPRPIAYPEL